MSNKKTANSSHTSGLQKWLENIWYEKAKGAWILLPLTGLYCAISRVKRWKDTRNQVQIDCPIIIVGNISVGGTGKTPLTIYTVKLLQENRYKPAIITRGYGGKATSWPQRVTATTDASLAGDEAVLMASRTSVPVYAGADRVSSITKILEHTDCDVIVSDDGLQHYKMPRDIQIAVIDGKRQLGNGYCLPAGPLRERKKRLDSCDLIVVNGEEHKNYPSTWLKMSLVGDRLINLKTHEEQSLDQFSEKTVNAVTGIGNPQKFYKTLKQSDLKLICHDFPDHHNFKPNDLDFNNDYPVLMTEKDAVKCKAFANENVWVLPVTAVLDRQFNQSLLDRIASHSVVESKK